MGFEALESNGSQSVWRLDVAARQPIVLPFLQINDEP
jgi:hypothetical protein